jgi:putative modified peptide
MFDQTITNTTFDSAAAMASFNGTNTLAHAFIERLATDDAFRAETVADPVAATAKYGFSVDRRQLPEGGITLPPKAVLAQHTKLIAEQFAASSSVVVAFRL